MKKELFKSFHHINQFRQTVESVRNRAKLHEVDLPTLTFSGTVKLHGTNCAVGQKISTGETWVQSRNVIITPESDHDGFAQYVEDKQEAFNFILKETQNVLKNRIGVDSGSLVIYGEWCGRGIQKKVAISELERMFVIFGIKYVPELHDLKWRDIKESEPRVRQGVLCRNSEFDTWTELWKEFADEPIGLTTHWIPIEETTGTWVYPRPVLLTREFSSEFGIYDIESFKKYSITIDFNDPLASVKTLDDLTNEVNNECPVAKEFGISGTGEGIVWNCYDSWIVDDVRIRTSDFYFKTKGDKHKESVKIAAAPEKMESIQRFVDEVVTQHRLEKMADKVKELGFALKNEHTPQFLKLIGEDVLREESDILEASGLDRKEVMSHVNRSARIWWLNLCKMQPL